MNADQARLLVASALARVLEISPESVTPATDLVEDLGVDSIGFIQLADVLELNLAQAGIRSGVSDDALQRFATVADVIEYVVALR